jgi:hypothetical protein
MTHKNLVLTDSDFVIEFDEKEVLTLACPRCGHMQERTPRSICTSCKHFIPLENCRQDWTRKYRSSYAQELLESQTPNEKRAVAFRASRGGFQWRCQLRKVCMVTSLVAFVVYGSAFGLKSYLGDAKFKVIEGQIEGIEGQVQSHLPVSIASK